ncbi:MAG: DUF6671 family protein [Fluviicola sp.]
MSSSIFSGRTICIATKHGKESVIGPKLKQAIGVEYIVPNHFDTDELGTFSGEVERTLTPIEAAREKCRRAIEQTNCDLAVASEGSFGAHPTLFLVPADEEFLVLLDVKNDIEIVARHLTTETNFGGESVNNWEALKAFTEKSRFPDHAVILKNSEKNWEYIKKGIQNEDELKSAFDTCLSVYGTVFAETDMRAMLNPSRMKAISQATDELIRKIQSKCPKCSIPGFDIKERQAGLPCSNCNMPTRSTLQHVYCCEHCNYEQIEKFPLGKEQEDPMYCDFCNP